MYFFFFLGWGSSIKSHRCSGCTKRGDPGQGLVQGTSPYLLILETEEGWVEREREGEREGERERERETERNRDRQTSPYHSTRLCTHWLILICALSQDWTCNIGVSGRCTNRRSHLARAVQFLLHLKFSSFWRDIFSNYPKTWDSTSPITKITLHFYGSLKL